MGALCSFETWTQLSPSATEVGFNSPAIEICIIQVNGQFMPSDSIASFVATFTPTNPSARIAYLSTHKPWITL